jgi:hypothetical protein
MFGDTDTLQHTSMQSAEVLHVSAEYTNYLLVIQACSLVLTHKNIG